MTQKRQFTMRFAVVALAVGLISPSVSINNNSTSTEDGYSVSMTVLNAAHAKKYNNKSYNKNVKRNKNVKKHHSGHHNGGHYNNHHNDNTAAKVLGGVVIGAAIANANNAN